MKANCQKNQCRLVPSCFLLSPFSFLRPIYISLELNPSSSQILPSSSSFLLLRRLFSVFFSAFQLIISPAFLSFSSSQLWRNLRPQLLCYCFFSVFRQLSPAMITVKLFPRVFSSSKLRDLVFSLVTRESLGVLTLVSPTANQAAYVSLLSLYVLFLIRQCRRLSSLTLFLNLILSLFRKHF